MPDDLGFLLTSAVRRAQLDIVGRVQVAAIEGVTGSANGVMALAAAFGSKLGNRADMTEIHGQVASEMRLAIMEAYQTTVAAGRKDYGARASSPARLSGRLEKALENEELVTGTARGINFVDADTLLKEAKHFARLNFGTAGPGQGGAPARSFPVSLFGSSLFYVGLKWGPSPAFYLPKGLFLGGSSWHGPQAERRGLDVFYPMGELPTSFLKKRADKQGGYDAAHPVKAIQARRFLDKGLEVMAEELPPAYNRLVQSWFARSAKGGDIYLKNLKLRGGRIPRNLTTSSQVRVTY